jgi:hypothetical protein
MQEQEADPVIRALSQHFLHRALPINPQLQELVRFYAKEAFLEDQLVQRQIKGQNNPSRPELFPPRSVVLKVLQDIHQHVLPPRGLLQPRERALKDYY